MHAPEVFDIRHPIARRELTSFLSRLRRCALVEARNVRIDFVATKLMMPAGTLLFASEIDRINLLAGARRVSCTAPINVVVAQVLKHVGIFEMLGRRGGPEITADNVKYWRVDSGQVVDGQQLYQAMDGYKDLWPNPEQTALYRGLCEAATNCRHHAYDGERGDGLANVGKWWMFSQVKEGLLYMAFCDLGIGIPRSLELDRHRLRQHVMGWLTSAGLYATDGNIIKGAMAIGKTRTGKTNRGKGLFDMRSVLDRLGGKMQIHSGRGVYDYDAKDGEEQCSDLMPILGTLIVWQIPLPAPKAP